LIDNGVLDVENGILALQSARVIYARDREFVAQMKEYAYYMKYDISGDTYLNVGDLIPECRLHTLEGEPALLSQFYSQNQRPLVIVAGSYS